MIEKIEHPAYENNVKKLNEVIDVVNNIGNIQIDTGFLATKNDLNNYVLNSAVGNEANKIPRYDAEGHLILPDGTEVYTTDDEVGIPSSSGEPTHFIGINSSDSTDLNYTGGGAIGEDSIAIGNEAECRGYSSVAIGPNAKIYDDYCDFSVAIGCDTEVTAENAIAIGKGAKVDYVLDGIAIGQGAQVTGGDDCVAIGNDSIANGFHEFSIGKPANGGESEFTRRITHVSNGIDDSDAVTLGQVKAMIAALRQELRG